MMQEVDEGLDILEQGMAGLQVAVKTMKEFLGDSRAHGLTD